MKVYGFEVHIESDIIFISEIARNAVSAYNKAKKRYPQANIMKDYYFENTKIINV